MLCQGHLDALFCKTANVSSHAVVGHWLALSIFATDFFTCHINAVLDATLLETSSLDT